VNFTHRAVSIFLDGIWMVPRWFSRAATKEHESSR
jgi:hypothetical protein